MIKDMRYVQIKSVHLSGQNYNLQRSLCSSVHSSTVHSGQVVETTEMSTETWMDREDVVYILTIEYHRIVKKDELLPFAAT